MRVEHPRCPFCHEQASGEAPRTGCPRCLAWSHDACLREGGHRCAACGGELRLPPRAPAPRENRLRGFGDGLAERLLDPTTERGRRLASSLLGTSVAVLAAVAMVAARSRDPLLIAAVGGLVLACALGLWLPRLRRRGGAKPDDAS